MRDPQGQIQLHADTVVRNLVNALPAHHFLHTALARQLVDEGKLIDFTFVNDTTLEHPRIPFVTYPHEWCNAQLHQAAQFTLDLSERILAENFELKDASAWNVLFDRGRPVFCDHLSFQHIQTAQWWAFGQYVRHFILPLVIHRYRGLHALDIFKIHRDGLNPETARQLMGARRWLTRFWPLMLSGSKSATIPSQREHQAEHQASSRHKGLYASTHWFMQSLHQNKQHQSIWSDYIQTRAHYSESDSQLKAQTVQRWLSHARPSWVIDLGCNTGEFSHMAHEAGAHVISIDLDQESIQTLHKSIQGRSIFPVVANLDDLIAARGWAAKEFPGLLQRLHHKADTVMMLALVHHLAISSSIPYDQIAELAAQLTRSHVIVELLHASDPLVQQLAAQRQRSPEEFAMEHQLQAFEQQFTFIDRQRLANCERELFLLQKK